MQLEAENWRLRSTTLVHGVSGELDEENWRLCSTTLLRGVSVELDGENWRLSSTTLVRGVIWRAGELRTGDFRVQRLYAEQSVELEA